MTTKLVRVYMSVENKTRLLKLLGKGEPYDSAIEELLNVYDEYQKLKREHKALLAQQETPRPPGGGV